jgi:hypothetical protein
MRTPWALAMTAVLAGCSASSPPPSLIQADYARISPGCKSGTIQRTERLENGVWVTLESCRPSRSSRMHLHYQQRGGEWVLVWCALVLDD